VEHLLKTVRNMPVEAAVFFGIILLVVIVVIPELMEII